MNTEHSRQRFGEPAPVFAQETPWRVYNENGVEALKAGRYAVSEKLLKLAVAEAEKFGASDPRLAKSLHNLAVLYQTKGKYDQAEPLYKRALAVGEKALGSDHPDVATCLTNFAALYLIQRKYDQAEPLFRRTLTIWEKALGPNHPNVATSLNNLALNYYLQGKYDRADPFFNRALVIREKALGPNHPDVATMLENYAALLKARTAGRNASVTVSFLSSNKSADDRSIACADPPEALTPQAWEAMPPELRAGIDHPHASAIYALMAKNTDESGHTFLSIADLAAVLGIEPRTKLTFNQSRSVAAIAEYAGFAVEPDARLTGQNYEWEELVAVFPHAYEGEPDYKRYGGAACILRLGVEIAEADGRVDDAELGRVMGHVEAAFQLNEHERRRLDALRTLLMKTGSDVVGLGMRIQAVMRIDERRAIGRLLVAVAGIDGVVTKQELTALHRCFRILDLPPHLLDATIAELSPPADETPIRVVVGRPAPRGELIPARVPREGGITLDRARIMGIIEETREVSILLAEAMRTQAEQDESAITCDSVESRPMPSAPPPAASLAVTVTGATTNEKPVTAVVEGNRLPLRYAAFYTELIAKICWTRAEAETLARSHGHMLSGAVEAVNDWAFDCVGGLLVYEDGDCIIVEKSLLENIVT